MYTTAMNAVTMPAVAKRTPTSFRLTDSARNLLEGLSEDLGVSQAAIVELAIRAYAATQGIDVPAASKRGRGRPRKAEPDDDDRTG